MEGSGTYGGAINNDGGTINFTGTNTFSGNFAKGLGATGGAIRNTNNGIINNLHGNFSDNYVSFSTGGSTELGGGAIRNDSELNFATDKKNTFTGNHVTLDVERGYALGGAIYNEGTINAFKADFGNNRAVSNSDEGSASGGAIHNSNSGRLNGITGDFTGNYAAVTGDRTFSRGGAINNAGTITSLSGDFTGNYATVTGNDGYGASGGAIYNVDVGVIDSIIGNFTGNYATVTGDGAGSSGGAIYNAGTINSLSGDFTDNYASATGSGATAFGGAIANYGTITFTGESNFSGNYVEVGGVRTLNDIYNKDAGTLELKGTMNLDGGIDGDSASKGSFNVYGGANLGFKVKNFTNGTFTTSADSTIIANQTVTFKQNNDTNDTVVTLTPTILAKNYAEGTADKYALFDGEVTVDSGVTYKVTGNALYDVTFDASTGVFAFNLNAADIEENILNNGGSSNDVKLANFLIDPRMGSSSNENFNLVQDNVSELYQEYQLGEVVKATKAMNPDEAPVISNASIDAVQSAFGIAGARLTGVFTPAKEVQKTTGKASGSDAKKEGVWAKGFYGQSKLKGDAGFKNKSWGIGFGFDHQFTPNFMLGVAYAYGQSDIDTDSRDIKAKTHTPVIYGEYKQKKWFIDGMLSYSFGKYDEKKSVTGVNDDVDYDVNVFGAQAIGGYAVTPWFIPEAGFRYFNVSQKDYTDNLGNNFDKKNANVFTGLIGAKFAKAFEASKGVNFIPELRLAASYDFVRDNNEVDVTLANMHSYTFKGEKLDRFGFEVDAGFKVDAGEFELAARYEGRFRNDFYNHTGLLEARYEF